jgi:hypothetical protein
MEIARGADVMNDWQGKAAWLPAQDVEHLDREGSEYQSFSFRDLRQDSQRSQSILHVQCDMKGNAQYSAGTN